MAGQGWIDGSRGEGTSTNRGWCSAELRGDSPAATVFCVGWWVGEGRGGVGRANSDHYRSAEVACFGGVPIL